MTNQQQAQVPPRRVRPKPRMVTVSNVERLTPGCVRVTFTGPELEGFSTNGPAEHIKVLFARPGESRVVLPEWGPDGPMLAEGQSMPPSRTYTPRIWKPESRELVVDFMLHGEGLASKWAQQAKSGDVLAVSGRAGGAYNIDPAADWFLLGADESALPGLATILDVLPAGKRTKVFAEVANEQEQQALTSPAAIDVTWLYRSSSESGSELKKAIRAYHFPSGDGRVWLGCEAEVMRSMRRHLIDERGMDRGAMHTHGYWKAGSANHPDHDIGQEI
jgi:NADPH-dependent ferric siderophore reductase